MYFLEGRRLPSEINGCRRLECVLGVYCEYRFRPNCSTYSHVELQYNTIQTLLKFQKMAFQCQFTRTVIFTNISKKLSSFNQLQLSILSFINFYINVDLSFFSKVVIFAIDFEEVSKVFQILVARYKNMGLPLGV